MKIYLAGPMRGIKDFNVPVFHRAAAGLRLLGYVVFSPAERDEGVYGKGALRSETGDEGDIKATGFSIRDALGADTAWICAEAEAIAHLPGWEKSSGACAEHALGVALGLRMIYLEESF